MQKKTGMGFLSLEIKPAVLRLPLRFSSPLALQGTVQFCSSGCCIPLLRTWLHKHLENPGWGEAGGVRWGERVLGISTILCASALQIKCKLKQSSSTEQRWCKFAFNFFSVRLQALSRCLGSCYGEWKNEKALWSITELTTGSSHLLCV